MDSIASLKPSAGALQFATELLGNTNSAVKIVEQGNSTQFALETGKKAAEGILNKVAPKVASKVALPLTLVDLGIQDALAIYEEYHELKDIGLEKPWKAKYQQAKHGYNRAALDMEIAIGVMKSADCFDECEESSGGTK